jgi:hypothetical protein
VEGWDSFDPTQLYLFGTLFPGESSRTALARLATPHQYVMGFDSSAISLRARIHDGKLLYLARPGEGGIRQFAPDRAASTDPSGVDYPSDSLRNDPSIDTAACSRPIQFLPGPDGMLVYRCPAGNWYDLETGDEVYSGGQDLLMLGFDGLAITTASGAQQLVDLVQLPDGPPTEIIGLTDLSTSTMYPLAGRASADGFHLVTHTDTDEAHLWEISPSGIATHLGTYLYPPAATALESAGVLDPSDALFQAGRYGDDGVVVRRTITGDSEIVYHDGEGWLFLVSLPVLTGP